jgi:F-type H+-transporting ATPase subunit a
MHQDHGFDLLKHLPFFQELPSHVGMTILVGLVVLVAGWIARIQVTKAMNTADGGLIPDETLTYRNFFEILTEKLYEFTEMGVGSHDAPKYFPMVGSIFWFIFVSNLIGLIPIFQPSTINMNTSLALGAFVFLYYNWLGFKENGLGYLKHFLGPVWWLAPLLLAIEIISHVVRPISLALRLRGNIMADHIVLGAFSGLVPYLVPIAFYGLGVFVAFMQAFVFSLMTMVYISMSTSHEH